jgi:tetratricopeptide (TPR) repeat protein
MLGQLDQAITDLNLAIKLDPRHGDAFHSRALALAKAGRVEAALADFAKAIELMPDNAMPFINRGHLLRGQARLDEALADLNRAAEMVPNHPVVLAHRGVVHLDQGHAAAAVEDLTTAIRLDPRHPPSYLHRAEALQQLGEHQRAVDDFTEFMKQLTRGRNDPPTLSGAALLAWTRASIRRGEAYRDLGELARARADFDAVLTLTHDCVEGLMARGFLALQMEDWRQTVEDLGKAVRLQSGLAMAHYGIGRALVQLGQPGQALREVVTALKLVPDKAEVCGYYAWLRLTSAETKYRDLNEALAWAMRACELTQNQEPHYRDLLAAVRTARGEKTQ